VWVLLRGLPRDQSNAWRDGNWTQQDELHARLIESIDFWGWTAAVIAGAGNIVPKPRPVWHPDRTMPDTDPVPRQVANDPAEIARFFARHVNPN
jgi:hypothetical protein